MRGRATTFGACTLGAMLLGMSGCVDGQATRFYVLTPTLAGARSAADEGSRCVGVGPVTLPGLLDRPEIVTRRNESEVERAEFDQWAEPLQDSIPHVLIEDLSTLLEGDRIEVRSWTDTGHCQYQAAVELTRFDGTLGKAVVLDARWRLLGEGGRELVVKRSVLREATHGSSYRDLVTTMSGALGALSQEIASALTHGAQVSQGETTPP
ncbi:MAG TPA: PqiC family protein [Candidatus Sulfotelmatobacter sp.]|nr:PqiC family protein [Candidatus Sulfotelmatobacter sp.]